MTEDEGQRKRRRRFFASLLSLCILALLLGGWCISRSSTEEDGKLGSVSTAEVRVTINPSGSASPTPVPSGGGTRRPPLFTEVLGVTEEASPTAVAASRRGLAPDTAPAAPILTINGLVTPGAYETGGMRVTNGGDAAFNLSISLTTRGDAAFAAALRLRIFLRVGPSCDYPGAPASGDRLLPLSGDQLNTDVYVGDFSSGVKIGDPSVDKGDGDIVIQAGQEQVLCMEVFFPWSAGNSYQGASVSGTIVFTAKTPE